MAEVANLDLEWLSTLHEDILWLNVVMNDVLLMEIFDSLQRLTDQVSTVTLSNAVAVQEFPEVAEGCKVHHETGLIWMAEEVYKAQDVRLAEEVSSLLRG